MDPTLALYRRIDDAMREPMIACSVPLYVMHPGVSSPDPWGTGTLFQIADTRLIVTASHVVKEAHKLERPLYTAATKGGPIIRLDGTWTGSPDPWDICILGLEDRACADLAQMTFLRLSDVALGIGREAGWFYLYGFPATWMESVSGTNKVRLRAMKYGVGPYAGDRSNLSSYDAKVHMLFEIGRDGATTPADGSPAHLPARYGGISGSSLWRAASDHDFGNSWDISKARVVGVQTGVYGDRVAKATRWEYVLTAVVHKWPDLRKVVELHQPDAPFLID